VWWSRERWQVRRWVDERALPFPRSLTAWAPDEPLSIHQEPLFSGKINSAFTQTILYQLGKCLFRSNSAFISCACCCRPISRMRSRDVVPSVMRHTQVPSRVSQGCRPHLFSSAPSSSISAQHHHTISSYRSDLVSLHIINCVVWSISSYTPKIT
jgi:hypothetical protein